MSKKAYILNTTTKINGKFIDAGETVELEEKVLENYIERGIIKDPKAIAVFKDDGLVEKNKELTSKIAELEEILSKTSKPNLTGTSK